MAERFRDEQEPRAAFVDIWQSHLSQRTSATRMRRWVSLLDEIGGPCNVAAYLAVLRVLRSLLGWGSRTRGAKGWLRPLWEWPLLDEIYKAARWIDKRKILAVAGIADTEPRFANEGYAQVLNKDHDYYRLPELVVLMALVRRGEGKAALKLPPATLEAAASIADLARDVSRRLPWHLRYFLRRDGSPRGMCTAYAGQQASTRWQWSPEGQASLQGIAAVGLQLAEAAPEAPEPPINRQPGAAPGKPREPQTRRPSCLSQFPRPDEIFRLPIVTVPRKGPTEDQLQPEDSECFELVLEPSEGLPEEFLSGGDDASQPTRGRVTPERRRAFVTARQRHALDALLVPSQQNALLQGEARQVVNELLQGAATGVIEGNRGQLQANVMLLLIAVAACSTQQARQFRYGLLTDALETHRKDTPVITPDGYLVRTVPMPPEHYHPAKHTEGLVDVGHRVVLRLPAMLQDLVNTWATLASIDVASGDALLFPAAADPGLRLISRRGEVIRGRTRVQRFTAQRLGNTLPLLLMESTRDVTVVQMLTADAHGLSLAGCAYYSAPMADLQAAFDAGITAMGFSCAAPDAAVSTLRVGSALCLQDTLVHERVKHLGHGLNYCARNYEQQAMTELIHWHNRMALYTGRLLEACLATRYHRTIGDLKLSDVALATGWIVIADKRTDAAHAARAVVVCPLALAQLRAFASHIDVLSRHSNLPAAIRGELRAARDSDRPLIFFIESDAPIAWDSKALARFDPDWCWPSNAMRHRAATGMRLQGCPGDFVAAQLGHADLGHMLGMDSPTPPNEYHATIGRAMDAHARKDRWGVRRGFGSGVWSEHLRLPKTREVRRLWVRLEKQERGYLRGQCPVWRPADPTEADALRQDIAAILETRIQAELFANPSQSTTDDAAAGALPCLDHELTTALRVAVAGRCQGDPLKVEWALGELRELMLEGERAKRWRCGDRRRVVRILAEPAPVAVGMIASHRAYQALCAWHRDALPRAMRPGNEATYWCWLVLGWVLWQGITDRTDIEAMLPGLDQACQLSKRWDGVMIPIVRKGASAVQATFTHGLTATIAARVHRQVKAQAVGVPSNGKALWEALEDWMRRTLPAHLQPPPGETAVTWLLEVTRLALRFELPGLLRALGEKTFTPTPLTDERMSALFDQRPPKLPNAIPMFPSEVDVEQAEIVDAEASKQTVSYEQELRDILRKSSAFSYHVEHDVAASDRAVRSDRIQRVEALLGRVDDRNVGARLVLQYALKLLRSGTPHKSHLADSTIYLYVCDVAAAFTRLGDQLPLPSNDESSLDGKALESLYRKMLEGSKNPRLREHLRYFQIFAEEQLGLPKISKSKVLNGQRAVGKVEVNLVTKREFLSALAVVDRAIQFHHQDAWMVWHLRAARVAMILMFRGTLRISEVVGRLHSDLFCLGETFIVSVHATKFGTLKSFNADRVVQLDDELTADERKMLDDWLVDTQPPAQLKRRASLAPLFRDHFADSLASHPMREARLEMFIGPALRAATGNPAARAHWLRHSAANYRSLKILGSPLRADHDCGAVQPLRRRSDVVGLSAAIGHGSISTTLTSYVHTLSMVACATTHGTTDYQGSELADILGISHNLLRRKRTDLTQRGRSTDELASLAMRRYWR